MSTQPILVTGAAGFIGSSLARALLARGERVVGVDNFDSFYDRSLKEANLRGLSGFDRFRFEPLDITDRERTLALMRETQPRILFHLAALAGVRPSIDAPERYVRVNLDGTTNLLDGLRALDGADRRCVFASSSSVYGNNDKVPFAEDDPVDHPISPYAATKRAGELLAHAYAHLFDVPIACLRFFTVFGPAQRPDLAIMKFMRAITAGEPIPMYGDGSTSRDYTFIDDIITGIIAASERIGTPDIGHFRIWNLGHSSPIRLDAMIDTVARVVGRPARIEPRPAQPGDVERTYADLARSRKELGYDPATPFEEGVRAQWAWLRERMA